MRYFKASKLKRYSSTEFTSFGGVFVGKREISVSCQSSELKWIPGYMYHGFESCRVFDLRGKQHGSAKSGEVAFLAWFSDFESSRGPGPPRSNGQNQAVIRIF